MKKDQNKKKPITTNIVRMPDAYRAILLVAVGIIAGTYAAYTFGIIDPSEFKKQLVWIIFISALIAFAIRTSRLKVPPKPDNNSTPGNEKPPT